jgi:hypothetical protein
MAGKKGRRPGRWFRLVVAGLAAVTALGTAAGAGGNDVSATSGGPSGCIVLRVAP